MGRSPLLLALRDIKLHHSVFALPFAAMGACLAAAHAAQEGPVRWPRLAGQLTLVVACMVFARTWAMLFNRIADRRFDAANPRTARRALASGALRVADAWRTALLSAAAFVLCCAGFWLFFTNPWPLLLSLPTLMWIAFYSLTKRFTWASHFFLGGALAASPLAAAIAIEPGTLASAQALWLIALMVLLWVAGFDALYALQDVDFDRRAGLCSLPARFGPAAARAVAFTLHLGAIAALLAAWRIEPRFGGLFLAGAVAASLLLLLEHALLALRGLAALPLAFFTVNGVVSLLLGAAGCVDALR